MASHEEWEEGKRRVDWAFHDIGSIAYDLAKGESTLDDLIAAVNKYDDITVPGLRGFRAPAMSAINLDQEF